MVSEEDYIESIPISLRSLNISEKWVEDRIVKNPSIIGLGDLELKERQRRQHNKGVLDLLLQDEKSNTRFTVELQLGSTDPSHIIRTFEYWDIEKRKNPNYDHIAVIIAENITGRFFNVINLFHGYMPIIAINMTAVFIQDKFSIIFTKIFDPSTGFLGDSEESSIEVSREYWEQKSNRNTMILVDEILSLIHSFDNKFVLNYNKHYIGLKRNNQIINFVTLGPKKKFLNLNLKTELDSDLEEYLESNIVVYNYNRYHNQYTIKIYPQNYENQKILITDLLRKMYEKNNRIEAENEESEIY